MEIKYTSVNDVYADYVFDFENTTANLEKLNEYALAKIKETESVNDSINQKIKSLSKEEAADYVRNNNLPTSAENIILYNTKSLNGEPKDENILIKYILDEDNFKIKEIQIPNYESSNNEINFSKTQDSTLIGKLKTNNLNLQIFKEILLESKKKVLSEKLDIVIKNSDDKDIFELRYYENGKYLLVNFK